MERIISVTKLKNFAIVGGMVIVMPFTYVVGQDIEPQTEPGVEIDITPRIESEYDFLETPSTFVGLRDPSPDLEFIPVEKARKGIVESVDIANNSLVVKIGENVLHVENNATTTFTFADEKRASIYDISPDMKIYAFGNLRSDGSIMRASRIIIVNKTKFQRK
jgi:hypothetical protein